MPRRPPRPPRPLLSIVALLGAAVLWLAVVHGFFRPRLADFRGESGLPPQARALAARHLALWEDPARRAQEIARMRRSNAEWDFMGRTYFVLSLANMVLRQPAEEVRYLAVIDAILDETLRLEAAHGMYFFLMPYAHAGPYRARPARSLFIDSEIALMLAARQHVRVDPRLAPKLAARIDTCIASMEAGPTLCAESYPDECWLFDNANAAAAIVLSDRLDGRDHASFLARWRAAIRAKLLDAGSGMLISRFAYDGSPMDGPEGSSIFMIAHALQVVDPELASRQYGLARGQLGRSVLGFGYAREWPESWPGPADIDSGPIIPVLGASAGSSGLAILGAAAFHDDAYLAQLLTTLNFAAFPIRRHGELRYAASNQVGDAVLLYAMVQGPLWQKALAPTAAPATGPAVPGTAPARQEAAR